MGVPDTSLIDLIHKVRSWVLWGRLEFSSFPLEIGMAPENCCMGCEVKFTELCHTYSCQGCTRLLCGLCARASGSLIISTSNGTKDIAHVDKVIKACKFCSKASKKHIEKIYPSESPRTSPEPPSPQFNGHSLRSDDDNIKIIEEGGSPSMIEFQDQSFSPHKMKGLMGHRSQSSLGHSPVQSDEEPEESARHFFSSSSEYYHDSLDIDNSVSFRQGSYSFRSGGSSPLDSPSRFNINTPRAGLAVHEPIVGSPDPLKSRRPKNVDGQSDGEKYVKHFDFGKNVDVWFPPPPEDENDESESNYFALDDDDDDDGDGGKDIGVPAEGFSSSSSLTFPVPASDKENMGKKEPVKPVIQSHFRALVSQLLQGEGITIGKENGAQDWLDIVSSLAWQAAKFIKPDTSKGGSMDPVDYVKIKCIASGSPSESTLVKGVVCTKNIKHKRMTSQYKNPRLLLLAGSLEYQRAQNQLASFNTLLEQEMNHLKMIVSKIEAHKTNVLLVEKTVSSYAQEYLLAKEISLVLNVKRPLLERIALCTGASITSSVDNISTARLGQCDLFRLERVSEEHDIPYQSSKRPLKTLMYFEGCPRRLGCTVLLKGLSREELKKVKHVVQYAVFAAYHLSLETSFLADEGAHLPKTMLKSSYSVSDNIMADDVTATLPVSETSTASVENKDVIDPPESVVDWEPTLEHLHNGLDNPVDAEGDATLPQGLCDQLGLSGVVTSAQSKLIDTVATEEGQLGQMEKKINENEVTNDYFAAADSQQSILVSFSNRCVSKGTLCERSRLLRIKFYGSFDKPLGRYLRDDLFDKASVCCSCKEPVEAHVQCYTHRQGSLTINVRSLDTPKLPGERDGKIWMWHRCLRCDQIDGIPPATRRVIMSDAAWGLSFGKFLELSFSNHATANRVANCGHSLQRDCLRFYGFGSMVAFFHYSTIDILTVHLPPAMLEFNGHSKQGWFRCEVEELKSKMETLYTEISDALSIMEQKSTSLGISSPDSSDLHKNILEFKDILDRERDDYHSLLQQIIEEKSDLMGSTFEILELNRLRHTLLIGSRTWDRQLYSLASLLNSRNHSLDMSETAVSYAELSKVNNDSVEESNFPADQGGKIMGNIEPKFTGHPYSECSQAEVHGGSEITINRKCTDSILQSPASNLSDKIDSAWTGTDAEVSQASLLKQLSQVDLLAHKRLMPPARVHSFDSAMRVQEKIQRGPLLSHLSAARSFHASGEYRSMVKDPIPNAMRTYSLVPPIESNFTPSFISSVSHMAEGPRLMFPQRGHNDLVIAVYDDEPTSVISYALSSKEYEDWVSDKSSQHDVYSRGDSTTSSFLSWQSFGSVDLDYLSYGGYGSEETSSKNSMMFNDPKRSPHLQISFDDDSTLPGAKVKFSVTCYFAKQFDMLRNKCCYSEMDFVCSLSRCRRWSAQGGKSNVYFAKSMDERFIIKQVTKTELDSFQQFARQYFKYLNDSLDSGGPTCLAKILGIFQVTIKQMKGGRETKMDLIVMENLFFQRKISKIYDLKGSLRSRYNHDTTGANKVLLDMNLLETLRTNPIFLGSKAKRRLERAVWNDTSFLASIDVMDYSLLVGVDEDNNELVLGIIDFMRQYTWDKHLETWVKASGILGGSKNASPTIISPKQYKRRFRKAMTTYFLTVPNEWSSS